MVNAKMEYNAKRIPIRMNRGQNLFRQRYACHASSAEKRELPAGCFICQCSKPMPRFRQRNGVNGNGVNENSASILFAFARRSKLALNMKKIARVNAIRRSISVGQMLMPEKKASGSSGAQYCATRATAKMMSGPPQTNQKVALTSARFKRSRTVPPPGNVRLAMLTLIQTAMASTVSATMMSFQMAPRANNQSRNHVLFDGEFR